jgi:hypothetical protein
VIIYVDKRNNYKKTEKENILCQIPGRAEMRVKDKKNYGSKKFYERVPWRNFGAAGAAFSS